jgi:hypothetical protein
LFEFVGERVIGAWTANCHFRGIINQTTPPKPADRHFYPRFFPEWNFGICIRKVSSRERNDTGQIEKKKSKLNNQEMRRAASELRPAFRPLGCGVGGWSSMHRGRCIGLRQFASSKGK